MSIRRQMTGRSQSRRPPTPKHEDTESKDNIDKTSIAGHSAAISTGDECIASSVKGRAEKSEGPITKEDDAQKEQEMLKSTGGAKAQKIMDELNDSKRMAKKIAELQQPKLQQKRLQQKKSQQMLKQHVSDIEKHVEEQRVLKAQLENQAAEIDRLQKQSEEKDQEIIRLRASLERCRKHAGFFSNAQGFSLHNPVMTDVQGDVHYHADREKRGNHCLLSNVHCLIFIDST